MKILSFFTSGCHLLLCSFLCFNHLHQFLPDRTVLNTCVAVPALCLSNSINAKFKQSWMFLPCTSSCSLSCFVRGQQQRSSPSVLRCSLGRFSGLVLKAFVPLRSRERCCHRSQPLQFNGICYWNSLRCSGTAALHVMTLAIKSFWGHSVVNRWRHWRMLLPKFLKGFFVDLILL